MLRDDAVGFARRVPGSELILMHVAGVGEQFEQRFIELLVVEFIDETRICLSDRIVKGALPFRRFVDRNERRTGGGSCLELWFLGLRLFSNKALESRKGALAWPTVIVLPRVQSLYDDH